MDEGVSVFSEMCRAAQLRRTARFSRFLNIAQQRDAEAVARKMGVACAFYGGREDCERKVFGVGFDEAPGFSEFPVACVRVARRGARFTKPLEHRDVLGSLMGLGIEREVTGDIAALEGDAYVFCLSNMADYIVNSLEKVGNSFVDCALSDPPEGALRSSRQTRVQVSSARADAVIARLFKLSRAEAQSLFNQRKIAIDDAICEKSDFALSPGQVVSVRGFGRAKYLGIEGQSKKGKYNLVVELYT